MSTTLSFKHFALIAIATSIAFAGYFTAAAPQARALSTIESLSAGDLFRGETLPAVYYLGADGYRYVFPTSGTYFTWYDNFDDVKTVADSDLPKVQIGGNISYKPGARMLKINSDPKTYAVSEGGVLRHVGSEAIAVELYGSAWNTMIDDMPDSFFGNTYAIGSEITSGSQYDVASVEAGTSSIDDDKGLVAPAEISITDNGFSPIDVTIDVGQGVRFTNTGSTTHNATADNLKWGTGTIQPGASKIRSFDEAGTYTFFDGLNSSSTGAIFVQ